jgi:anthocyanidin 3-O-glucosyltransferase
MTLAGPEELRVLAEGMEASGKPFLWSLPEESWPLLPPGFMDLERAKVVPFVPQVQVLQHPSVGAFVMHAGWASVLEAVCSGVPMACRPFYGDQMMNARLLHLLGLSTTLDEPLTRRGVASAVASLLNAEEGARMWSKMEEVKAMAANAFAPGGGSRNNLDKLANIVCAVSSPVESHLDSSAKSIQ